LKKLTCSVLFYKSETEKTEPNPNRKKSEKNRANPKNQVKPSQTKKIKSNQFEPVFVLRNQTEPNQNWSV
jgi:hypothetical protein